MQDLPFPQMVRAVRIQTKRGKRFEALACATSAVLKLAKLLDAGSGRNADAGTANACVVGMLELSCAWKPTRAEMISKELAHLCKSADSARFAESDRKAVRSLGKYLPRVLSTVQEAPARTAPASGTPTKTGKRPRPTLN